MIGLYNTRTQEWNIKKKSKDKVHEYSWLNSLLALTVPQFQQQDYLH